LVICWLSSTRELSQIWLFVGYHPQENLAKFGYLGLSSTREFSQIWLFVGYRPPEIVAKFGYM
jgi:hypothetical protein